MNVIVDSRYSGALLQALAIQIGLLLFSAFGQPDVMFVHGCMFASIGFWLGTVIVLIRRPQTPTDGDLWYVRKGLLLVGVGGMIVALVYWDLVVGVMDATSRFNNPRI